MTIFNNFIHFLLQEREVWAHGENCNFARSGTGSVDSNKSMEPYGTFGQNADKAALIYSFQPSQQPSSVSTVKARRPNQMNVNWTIQQ